MRLVELDLAARTIVQDGFSTPPTQVQAVWLDRDTLLIAHALAPAPRTRAGGPARALLWRRGQPLSDASTVFDLAPDDTFLRLTAAGHGPARRGLIVAARGLNSFSVFTVSVSGDVVRLDLPPQLRPFAVLAATEQAILMQLAEPYVEGGREFAAGDLLAYDLTAPPASAISPLSLVHAFPQGAWAADWITGFSATRSAFHFVEHTREGLSLCSAHRHTGGWTVERRLSLGPGRTLRLGVLGSLADPNGEDVWAEVSGLTTPTQVLDVSRATPRVVHAAPALFDAFDLCLESRCARSADGTMVDYLLLRPRNLPAGGAPTLLTGYGAFGVRLDPAYLDFTFGGCSLALWLERGGALAIAAGRGGGERDGAWHKAAQDAHRQRAYDDFAGVAEHLLSSGAASPGRLGAFGWSNGGLLAAVTAVQRPELFDAVVCDAPLLDMLSLDRLGAGPALLDEYGDPRRSEDRERLLRYCPYANLDAARAFPPFLITVSTADDRVTPAHARKFVAKAQSLGLAADLIELPNGGHRMSQPHEKPDLMAARMTFLVSHLMGDKTKPGAADSV